MYPLNTEILKTVSKKWKSAHAIQDGRLPVVLVVLGP